MHKYWFFVHLSAIYQTIIGSIVHQLTRNLNDSQIKDAGFAPYFVNHTIGVYSTSASGSPWNAASMAVK